MPYISNYGTREQIDKYMPRLSSGEMIGAIAMTEPGAGSDLQVSTCSFQTFCFSFKLDVGIRVFAQRHEEMVLIGSLTAARSLLPTVICPTW